MTEGKNQVSDALVDQFWEAIKFGAKVWPEVAEAIQGVEEEFKQGLRRMLADAKQCGHRLSLSALKDYFPDSDDSLILHLVSAFSTRKLVEAGGTDQNLQVVFKTLE